MIVLGLSGPLDTSITIPVIGVRLTLRQLMQSLCTMANMDKNFCQLVSMNPTQACQYAVSKGSTWIRSNVLSFVSGMVNKIAGAFKCPTNWKDALINAIQFHFDSETGISVDVDFANVAADFFCLGAKLAVTDVLTPFANSIVMKLQAACRGSSSPAGSSVVASASPSASSSSSTAAKPATPKPVTPVVKASAPKAILVKPPSVYSTSKVTPVLVWGTLGVALLGTAWFVLRR